MVDKAGISSILVAHEKFACHESDAQPPVSSAHRLVISPHSVPGACILVSFSKRYCTKSEPKQEPYHRERMHWRDQQVVVDEESHQEMQSQKTLDMAEDTKLSVAVPNTPLSEWQQFAIRIVLEEEIEFVHAKL